MKSIIKINPADNVCVALSDIKKGFEFDGITVTEDIPRGHKIACEDIKSGDSVVKYGSPIGKAVCDIKKGEWVHTHNLKTGLGDLLEYTYNPVEAEIKKQPDIPCFKGFRRSNGKAAVRNEIWIIPTVGCVNSAAKAIEAKAQSLIKGSIDAITAYTHPYGCSQMGEDQENSRKILADLINHPNAGGVLVLGLGCENSGIPVLKEYIGSYDESRVKFVVAQECEDEIAECLKVIKELSDTVSKDERADIPVSELVIGMKCGGSDGMSGITANPLVGAFSDKLVSMGGTTILTEVPEMFGAETLLMNRCESKEVFDKTVKLINDFKNYYISHNQTIYENPSPGNKKGGISTLEDKSLGCTQKSGSAPVIDVLDYAERVSKKGLNLLSAPGNDLVAATALAASGAHIVLFTTGRGTPFASPVPTVKISSNSELAARKSGWIDFNAGKLAQDETIGKLSDEFLDYIIRVASGEKVKSEVAGYHDFAIFKNGVTL